MPIPGQPVVSCVMGAFNAERYVAESVESIMAQTFRNFEFIIIDDGSTDATSELLEEYASQDDRIRLVHQANRGHARSLQVGSAMVRGDFLARMDADDIADPRRFERQVAYLSNDPACVVVGSSLLLIDPDGEPLGKQDSPPTHDQIMTRLLAGDGAIPHPTAMIRMAAFQQVGGYREQYCCSEDLDLWLRLSEIGTLANLPEPLLRYRLHYQSISTQRRAEQLQRAREAVHAAKLRRGLPTTESLPALSSQAISQARLLRSWSRMAIRAGNLAVARKHAWTALRLAPWSPSNLGLFASLLLRRSKHAA